MLGRRKRVTRRLSCRVGWLLLLVLRPRRIAVARGGVTPSALREVFVEIPDVRWADIAGADALREQLRRAVEWPLRQPAIFARLGLRHAVARVLPARWSGQVQGVSLIQTASVCCAAAGPEQCPGQQ